MALAALVASAAEDPADLAAQAQRNAEAVTLRVTPGEFADVERVRRGAETGAARGRSEFERQAAERRARTEVTVSISEEGLQQVTPEADQAVPAPVLAGRLVVAISSSMPAAMVREYARQLDGNPEAILVLRGFIGGAREVKPTVEWIEQVLRRSPASYDGGHFRVEVVVDPLAFRMLGIDQVPAMAFLPGVQDLRHCDAEQLRATRIAYGAVSVRGALDELGRDTGVPEELRRRLGGAR